MIYADSDPSVNWLNDWLVNYGIYIAIGVAGAVFIVILILFLISLKKRKEAPLGIPHEVITLDEDFVNNIQNAIGGKDNLLSYSLNGSRIILTLKNYDLINEKLLTECGVDSFIKMSNKITLVSKQNSEMIYKAINQ